MSVSPERCSVQPVTDRLSTGAILRCYPGVIDYLPAPLQAVTGGELAVAGRYLGVDGRYFRIAGSVLTVHVSSLPGRGHSPMAIGNARSSAEREVVTAGRGDVGAEASAPGRCIHVAGGGRSSVTGAAFLVCRGSSGWIDGCVLRTCCRALVAIGDSLAMGGNGRMICWSGLPVRCDIHSKPDRTPSSCRGSACGCGQAGKRSPFRDASLEAKRATARPRSHPKPGGPAPAAQDEELLGPTTSKRREFAVKALSS
jgi:hypothetical protein